MLMIDQEKAMKKKQIHKLVRLFIYSIIIIAVIVYHIEYYYDTLNLANSLFTDILFTAAIVGIFLEIYKKDNE